MKQYADAVGHGANGIDTATGKPIGDQPVPPPEMTQTLDDWRAAHPRAAVRHAGPLPKITQPTDPLQVTNPKTGVTYRAKDKATADAARKAYGIQ